MTHLSNTRRVSARAALGAAALSALVLGCTAIAAETGSTNATGPVACAVTIASSGGNLIIEGVVEGREAVSGNYHLRVSRSGSLMNQGGPFSVAAGSTATLGRVMMNGPASAIDAELTLTVNGRELSCPTTL